jgi:general stress protein YciG
MAHHDDKHDTAPSKAKPASKDHDLSSEAGRKGGQSAPGTDKQHRQSEVGSGKQHDANNFANDRQKASEAGKKGGQHS